MFQRFQSICLIVAALAGVALFFIPYGYTYEGAWFKVQDDMITLILTIAVIGLSVINIFLFKNRPLQIKITGLTIMIGIGLLVAMLLVVNTNADDFHNKLMANTYIGGLLAMLVLAANIAAYFWIRRDERIVRSADRLR